MGRRFVHWKGPVAATLILVLFIAAASFIVTGRINEAEEAVSFTRLAEEAEEFAHSLELNVDSDRDGLRFEWAGGIFTFLPEHRDIFFTPRIAFAR